MARWIATASLFLLIQSVAEAQLWVSTAILDAYPNRDGSVSLAYRLELPNTGQSSVENTFTLSLPTSKFQIENIHAYRCDVFPADQLEQSPSGLPVEKEYAKSELLQIRRHPDPDLNTEIVIDFGEHPLRPNETAELCVDAVVPDFIARDFICSDSAYVPIRPTLYYGTVNDDTDIFVNIHLPEGVPASRVLAQQEWPQPQIQNWLPVREENGHAVARWHKKATLSEIYWITAIFPAGDIKTKKPFDGLQTDIRLVPKETLNMDVTIEDDSSMRVNYDLDLENTGSCKPVDKVQLFLSGESRSISGNAGGDIVNLSRYPDVYPSLRPYLETTWFEAINAKLLPTSQIPPGKSGSLHIRSVQSGRIELTDPRTGTVSLALLPIASASGYWQPGSRWITRIHFPKDISANLEPITPGSTKEIKNGMVVLTWDQTENPGPMTVHFPIGHLQNVNWNIEDKDHWLFVVKHAQHFPRSVRTAMILLTPIAVVMLISILRRRFRT